MSSIGLTPSSRRAKILAGRKQENPAEALRIVAGYQTFSVDIYQHLCYHVWWNNDGAFESMLRINGGSTTEDIAGMFLAYSDAYLKVVFYLAAFIYVPERNAGLHLENENGLH